MISPDQDLHPAHAKQTHAVDILAFVEAQEIPSLYFETPYYLAPAPGGEKDYALLRETLRRTRKIGIAYVVIEARQHLAVLVPQGQSLVLNTLRWTNDPLAIASIDFHAEDDLWEEWADVELESPAQPWGRKDLQCEQCESLCHDFAQAGRTAFSSHAIAGSREPEVLIDTMADIFGDEDDDEAFDADAEFFEELFAGRSCRAAASHGKRHLRRQRHLRSRVRWRRASFD